MPPSNTLEIRVLLVEDDEAFRTTLRLVVDGEPGLACAGEAESLEEALALLDLNARAGTARPDVVLLDVNLPGQDGVEGLGRLKAHLPGARIVMLTIRDDADTIFAALRAGASGYLVKDAPLDRLVAGLREAHAGGMLVPPVVTRKVLGFFQAQAPAHDYGLTERETEVLEAMAEGLAQKEIAERLFVSPHTVNSHVQRVYEKLHVRSATAAVAKALREHLVRVG